MPRCSPSRAVRSGAVAGECAGSRGILSFFTRSSLGELVVPSAKGFDPARHVARGSVVEFGTSVDRGRFVSFHIPWTKSTHTRGADVILKDVADDVTPYKAIRHHLRANAKVPASAPMFSFERAGGGWAPMTRDWFLGRCNEIWTAAGLENLTGHCFRIGGTTEWLMRGTNPDIVATLGSWESRAFLKYWRRIECILPLFLSQASDTARIVKASDAVSVWKKRNRLRDKSN